MNIGLLPINTNACGYYRILIPFRKMAEKRSCIHPVVLYTKYINNIDSDEAAQIEALHKHTDIIVVQRRFGHQWEQMAQRWKQLGKTIVYEIDDTHEGMPSALLKGGYRVMYSPKTMRSLFKMMSIADVVTTATPELCNWVMKGLGTQYKSKVVVLKNTLDFRLWPAITAPVNDNVITVGYAGGAQHQADLEELHGGLHQISEIYNTPANTRVMFGFMGSMTKELWSLQPHVAYKHGAEFLDYPGVLAKLRYDIGIAPVVDCLFNACKSELRYLEYSALGIPTAATDIAPYRRAIGENEDRGLLVKNKGRCWKSALRKLIDSEDLRLEMGKRAYEYVYKYYNIDTYVDEWLRVFKQWI